MLPDFVLSRLLFAMLQYLARYLSPSRPAPQPPAAVHSKQPSPAVSAPTVDLLGFEGAWPVTFQDAEFSSPANVAAGSPSEISLLEASLQPSSKSVPDPFAAFEGLSAGATPAKTHDRKESWDWKAATSPARSDAGGLGGIDANQTPGSAPTGSGQRRHAARPSHEDILSLFNQPPAAIAQPSPAVMCSSASAPIDLSGLSVPPMPHSQSAAAGLGTRAETGLVPGPKSASFSVAARPSPRGPPSEAVFDSLLKL